MKNFKSFEKEMLSTKRMLSVKGGGIVFTNLLVSSITAPVIPIKK